MPTTSHLKRKSKAPRESYTPPMSRSRNTSTTSFDSCDYFCAQPYKPLSSLPTPPLSSSSHSTRQSSPEERDPPDSMGEGDLPADLLGPATHLTNLIPPSTSLITPSVPLVHTILSRASLPLETLALAVAILDSLNSRFALQWRKCLHLSQNQHIDEVNPEIIVLAALVLAVKFLEDEGRSTRFHAMEWGGDRWGCEMLNETQRCLLENLGWRLLPLWDGGIIAEAMEDMRRAGLAADAQRRSAGAFDAQHCYGGFGARGMSAVKAVLGLENQLTRAETPGTGATSALTRATKEAFRSQGVSRCLELPDRTRGPESFQLFAESAVVGMTCDL